MVTNAKWQKTEEGKVSEATPTAVPTQLPDVNNIDLQSNKLQSNKHISYIL